MTVSSEINKGPSIPNMCYILLYINFQYMRKLLTTGPRLGWGCLFRNVTTLALTSLLVITVTQAESIEGRSE